MTYEASAAELATLWDAVTDDDQIEQASDGHLRWAFLLDFARKWVGGSSAGAAGAIVHAEDGQGPIAAWFYTTHVELEQAWNAVFVPSALQAVR